MGKQIGGHIRCSSGILQKYWNILFIHLRNLPIVVCADFSIRIGQKLGLRTESVNFVHDVNVLRQTLKSVYENSADLQALNSEIDKLPKNCRIQVLPVCWRHLLDFPRKGVRQTRQEHDLGDVDAEEIEYPSLEDITVEGVPFVRSLITDLALVSITGPFRDNEADSSRIYCSTRVRTENTSAILFLLNQTVSTTSFESVTRDFLGRLLF